MEDLHIVITRFYFFSLKCSGFSPYLTNSLPSIASNVTSWVGWSLIPPGRACTLYCLLFKRTSLSCNLSADMCAFWLRGDSGQRAFFPARIIPIPTPDPEKKSIIVYWMNDDLPTQKDGMEVPRLSLQECVCDTWTQMKGKVMRILCIWIIISKFYLA